MTHDAIEVIHAKRDGGELSDSQIDWVVRAYTDGRVADEQMSALTMAILLRGMNRREIARFSKRDSEVYPQFSKAMGRMARFVKPIIDMVAPDPTSFSPFELGKLKGLGDKIRGMSIFELRGFGRQRGHSEVYRGAEYKIDFVPKIRLEIVCKDEEVETLIALISVSARTGKVGDGKIFISDIADVIRIRTGERGTDAI